MSYSDSMSSPFAQLLSQRDDTTERLVRAGLNPPLLCERSLVYEALGYADLAAADAFVAYTLCEAVRSEEWVSDLEPVEISGEPWPLEDDEAKSLSMSCRALAILYRSLITLGATKDAEEKFDELTQRYAEHVHWKGDEEGLIAATEAYVKDTHNGPKQHPAWRHSKKTETSTYGASRREIYPWNKHEPDRNSPESLIEINSILSRISPDLRAEITALPALSEDGTVSDGVRYQLGLFADRDLTPGTEILREKSLLTAIRPLDDALCDACGADLEFVARDTMRQCPGNDCDTTFCSKDCANRAASEYHNPNIPQDIDEPEDDPDIDPDYAPPHAPFCGNAALHEIGRTSSTTTAEWDLYFLLLTRSIQMSMTQGIHPLSLPTTKYLWGDFDPTQTAYEFTAATRPQPHTLPWSLHHNLTLPLQYFETSMHSRPEMTPYSAYWIKNHDWWIQSTLLAKFRGVANAQQSTFDGKAEIAAVHPMWCLANHSCEPNVSWTPTGERVFKVRERDELVGALADGQEWRGIREGEEIWSHYTDIRLPIKERRERLMEVLGGACRCTRCLREEREG